MITTHPSMASSVSTGGTASPSSSPPPPAQPLPSPAQQIQTASSSSSPQSRFRCMDNLNSLFQNLGTELQRAVEEVAREIDNEKEILRQKKQEISREVNALEQEKKIMEERVGKMEEVVELNVGGVHFTTTRSTLTSIKGTMLEGFLSLSLLLCLLSVITNQILISLPHDHSNVQWEMGTAN